MLIFVVIHLLRDISKYNNNYKNFNYFIFRKTTPTLREKISTKMNELQLGSSNERVLDGAQVRHFCVFEF